MVDQCMVTANTIRIHAQPFGTNLKDSLNTHGHGTFNVPMATINLHRPEAIMRVGSFGAIILTLSEVIGCLAGESDPKS